MEYYQKGITDVSLIEDSNILLQGITKKDFKKTQAKVKEEIKDFREKYKNGIVVLTCHTGGNFADECAKDGGIDIIFDAHEHKNEMRIVNGTPIVALSQNFEKITNAKININDKGRPIGIIVKDKYPKDGHYKTGSIGKYHKELFEKDAAKIYTINSEKELDTKNLRRGNCHLANFVTDAIFEELAKKDSSIDIFALNSSSIRGGFKKGEAPTVSRLDVLNCLDGITEDMADIVTNEVSGKELTEIVLDNFLFNNTDPDKNSIIQYSGIKINRTDMMKSYLEGKPNSKLCEFITLSKTGKAIEPCKKYKIANVKKYFIKSHNSDIREMYKNSQPTGENACELFLRYFDNHPTSNVEFDNRIY